MSLAITRYLDAGYPVLYVRTTEHNRALEEILSNLKSAGLLDSLTVMVWKSTIGLYNVTSACPKEDFVAEDLKSSLEYIAGTRGAPAPNRLYVIFNPKDFLKNPIMLQQLKDTAYAIRSAASHIIMVGCSMEIPEEIEDVVTTIDMELPDKETIKGIFRSVTTEYASELSNQVTERDLDVAADNALGLSAFKAENAISLSIVESKGIDIGLIRKEKQLAVKQSGVLEYIHHTETVDSLGGFDVLKDHVSKRKRYFSNHKEAVEFGLRPPKGIMLVGIAGCVSGDTKLLYRRGNRSGGRSIRLDDFYKKFNGIPTDTRPWEKDCDTYLQSYDAETERIRYNKVLGVVDMGQKRCVTIHTDSAGSITLTLDHPVLCADGLFHPAEQIAVGAELLVRGSMMATGSEEVSQRPRRQRVTVEALKYHPTGWKHSVASTNATDMFEDVKTYDYVRQHRARLVIEAHMNKMPLHEFVQILKTDEAVARELVYLPQEVEVHHLDEDPCNDTLSNLVVMSKSVHTAHHCGEERFNKEYVKTAVVTGIEDAGEIAVYDISMQEPTCNFVSEGGIVVHNTGKSLAAKAVSAALELPLYKFDVGSVFKGVVGQSIAGDEEIFLTASTASGLPIYRRTKIADAQALFESGAQVATLGADESGRLSTTETTDFFKHRSAYKKLLKIRTQRGREVVVTPEHSLFTNGVAAGQLEVVAADKVRKGTRLAIPSNAPDTTHQYTSFRKTDLLHLYELDAQKYQSLPDDICLTEEFAELCGWWLAEGSTTESSYRMCVHNDSLQRVTSLVEGMGESPRIYDTQHSEMCRDVHVGSRISRMLELFGFGGVGVAKRVPEIVFSWEHRFIAALLRGYISGDGSFSTHCLEVTTISDGMLRDVRFLLTLFGIVPGTGNKKQATMRSIMGRKPSRCKEAFRLTVTSRTSLRILLDRIGPFLDNITCPLEEYLGEDTTADRGECYPLTLDLIAELKKAQRLIWKITGECRVTMGVDVVSRSKLDRIFHLTGMTEAEFAHSFPAIHRIRTWNICFDRVQSIEEVDSPAFVYDISVPASELFYVHGGLLVHNSEAALRNALKLAETVSPCVMLLDEMEKLLAGVESSGKTDSGVTSRVIGTLISWMQETKAPIYKLATCNTIRNLDAALFRRGRWDAVFAVDLPNEEERKQIISIHIQKRGRSVDSFDLTKLAGVTESFVGAEIESVVDEAMYIAFDAERDMTTEDLVTVANGVVPISRTDQEAIQSFRQWMETRATPVSKVALPATAQNIRNLRIA